MPIWPTICEAERMEKGRVAFAGLRPREVA